MKKGDTMRFVWVFILIIMALIAAGCGKQCDEPYKLIGETCCIDDDNSGVCDLQEFEAKLAEEQKEPAETIETAKPEETMPEQMIEKPEAETAPETEPEIQVQPEQVNQDKIPDRIHSLIPSIEPEKEYESEYALDRPQGMEFELTNLKYGYGRLREVDVKMKNDLNFDADPRIQVYAIQDGEYKKVKDILYKTLSAGKTRSVEQDNIGIDIDEENTEVKFEFYYHSPSTGLTKVGEMTIPLN